MGNTEVHEGIPLAEDTDLDLSEPINYRSYCKHINGEYSDQCLSELPAELTETVQLYKRLNLSFNCFSIIPDELPYIFPHLSVINISHNELTELPSTIGHLFHLQELLATHNKLMTIPVSMITLSKLEKLDFSYNCLTTLPEKMGQLPNLKKLNVSHNKLNSLPLSLGNCATLQILLAVSNNCTSQPPQTICDKGSNATLAFLKKSAVCNVNVNVSNSLNEFPRVRGNTVKMSVPNPDSARAEYVQRQTETMNTASRIRTPLLPPYDATKLPIDKLKDKIIGLIYGAAIGDALGIATEFLTIDECKFHYNEQSLEYKDIICDEHRVHWKKGDWTSNFDQILLVLEALLQWAGVIDELEFAKLLVMWKKHGIRGLDDRESYIYSSTINLVLQIEDYVKNPHKYSHELCSKGIINSNGAMESSSPLFVDSGALPRAVLLGIPHFHDMQEVISNSVRICRATHHDERCVATCVSLSVAVALMIKGEHNLDQLSDVTSMLQTAEIHGCSFINNPDLQSDFKKISKCDDLNSVYIAEGGKLCHTFKPYATAFCALRQQKDFKSSLVAIVMQGGYSSMNGCITGALLGCKFGFSKLPKEWIEGLLPKNKEFLNTKINALLDMMACP